MLTLVVQIESTKNKLFSPNGGNEEIYIIIQKMQLLLPNENDIPPFQRALSAERLFSFLERIFSSKAVGEAFVYLLDKKACTAWLLQIHLDMPEPTAYRVLKRLRSLGVLEKVMRIKRRPVKSSGGPRPTIWAILGASREDIAEAIGEHNRSLSPKYRVAEEIVQAMMKDFISIKVNQEITRKEIHFVLNEFKMPYKRYDVQLFIEQIFKAKGIKVW